MQNRIFDATVRALGPVLGSPEPLASGNGVRFKSEQKGKATVYHSEVSTGNQAEVAFHVDSTAARLRTTTAEFRSLISALRASTGRPVQPNAQYDLPRIGLTTEEHVAELVGRFVSLARGLAGEFGFAAVGDCSLYLDDSPSRDAFYRLRALVAIN